MKLTYRWILVSMNLECFPLMPGIVLAKLSWEKAEMQLECYNWNIAEMKLTCRWNLVSMNLECILLMCQILHLASFFSSLIDETPDVSSTKIPIVIGNTDHCFQTMEGLNLSLYVNKTEQVNL